jgi:hypothetical protein
MFLTLVTITDQNGSHKIAGSVSKWLLLITVG